MAEKNCPKHGNYQVAKCPACKWIETYGCLPLFATGCPRCGKPLSSNGFIMWCVNDKCSMRSTSEPAD
jgi:hypothetical protein